MNADFPDYLDVAPDRLGAGTPVHVRIVGQASDLAHHMAEAMFAVMNGSVSGGRPATIIVPVGPVDQFPVLAAMVNQRALNCQDVVIINMDEYLDDRGNWIAIEHPLSFRGYMNRRFYDLIDPSLAPRPENRVFPDPHQSASLQALIDQRHGVDVCFGGIGINGHIAFNEPPEPGEVMSVESFASLPTRVLELSRETRTINSVTVGGEISVVPQLAVTVGMREILASRQLRFYCNRPWQSSVVRRLLHGPITAACPSSLLRTHADAELAIADLVAAVPDVQLR